MESKDTGNEKLTALLETAMAFARREFDARVNLSDLQIDEQLYGLGMALNMLGEELGATTVDKEYVESIVQAIADTMIVLSPEGDIRSINSAGCELLGYEQDELIGKSLKSFIDTKNEEQLDELFEKFLSPGIARSFDVNLTAKDGSSINVQVRSSILHDRGGTVSDVILLARDMRQTIKLLSEAAEAKAHREKALQLQKAYDELKEAHLQLVQAGKLAVLGEMVAGVAHELNQPLNSIKIITQGILRSAKKQKYSMKSIPADGEQIIAQVNRMAEIINHMRVFTRKPEGGYVTPVDINKSIEDALSLVSQQLTVHNIKVEQELTEDLPQVFGDPNGLQQILLNLITNAKDAIIERREIDPEPPGKISIRANFISSNAVSIAVADNGGGIEEEALHKIFDAFYTTKEIGKGTGLGLSISKRIVESYRGRIEVEKLDSKGMIFKIILPFST